MPASSACGCRKIPRNISATRRRSAARPCAARAATCAFAEHPENLHFKVAVARALSYAQREEKVALFREAAAQGDAEAYYEIYEHHKSWDRGDLDQVPLVTRAEADRALHKAAELGHPFSTQMLAILLDRGTTVKRDPVAARYWAGRAVANPAKDAERGQPSGAARAPAGDVRPAGRARPRPRHPRADGKGRPVRRQARIGDRDPQGRSGARACAAGGIRCGPIPAARRHLWPKC